MAIPKILPKSISQHQNWLHPTNDLKEMIMNEVNLVRASTRVIVQITCVTCYWTNLWPTNVSVKFKLDLVEILKHCVTLT